MLPVHIFDIHNDVSTQDLVRFLNDNLPASARVEESQITFIASSGGSKSTILQFRNKSALRAIKKLHRQVLHTNQISIDTDFYGLTILWEGTDPEIDIVAVHGLNGHAFKTWATETGSMWLRDMLHKDIPNSRILTYGYDAKPNSSSFAGINDFVQGFLAQLEFMRRNVGTRKLLLIGHSLGGIVIKQALIRARESPQYQLLIDHLSGVVFLGTPHRGSNITTAALFIARLAKVANVHFRRNLIRILQRDSEVLFQNAHSFERFLKVNALEIKSFYETQKTGYGCAVFRTEFLVVDQASAVPNLWSEPIPLNANHTEMCKFDSSSADYKLLCSNIEQLACRGRVINTRTEYLTGFSQVVHQGLEEVQATDDLPRNDISTLQARLEELQTPLDLGTAMDKIQSIMDALEQLGIAADITNRLLLPTPSPIAASSSGSHPMLDPTEEGNVSKQQQPMLQRHSQPQTARPAAVNFNTGNFIGNNIKNVGNRTVIYHNRNHSPGGNTDVA